ncbi:cation-dependent mannose-6-phosphate receptor [Plakobranchus ocellatus]|uniref:Cation-dependent mannose-6-phosphate receptor n=1 Tax=Plakobranchus ocellatus TaxID=259542 RepID=A0AAV3XYZ0_9GAST|nr:cation-dependent mannose-6-phosphate receptor [Plakobranchus ocellatus]
MYQLLITLFIILGGITSCHFVSGDACNPTETAPCTCSTENGKRISLEDLMKKRKGYPLTANDGKYTYYIQPCNRLVQISQCEKLDPTLVSCQIEDTSLTAFGLGVQNKYVVVGDPALGTVALVNQYTDSNGFVRIMRLHLHCSEEEGTLIFENQTSTVSPITYNLRLDTVFACLERPGSSSSGLSAGSVLVILFFVAIVIYLVGGTLFLKYVRKAEGKETIPNYEFWTDFPSLVKDGILFTCRGCKAESTYEKI